MARPRRRPKEKKELDRLLMDLDRARTEVRKAQKPGGHPEWAEQVRRQVWSVIHSHCDRHELPLPTDSADDPFRVEGRE